MSQLPQDPDLQPMYCAWAMKEFDRPNVTEVRFEDSYDYGYSEYTPGAGAMIDVEVKSNGRWRNGRSYTASFELPELIASIARFSLTYKGD